MIRHVVTILKGTAIAQLISFASLPILTRLFTPEAFGHLQLYSSLLVVLIVIPSLRYDIAILKAPSDEEADAIASLCIVANVVATVLTFAVLTLVVSFPPPMFEKLAIAPWVLAGAMGVGGLAQVFTYLALRRADYLANARSKIVQAFANSLGGIGLGVAGAPVMGLLYADFAGRFAMLAYLRDRCASAWRGTLDVTRMREVAVRYRDYPLYALPGGIVNSFGVVLTPLLIYATFSPATAGQFGLVERSLSLPASLIASSVAQVYTAQLGEKLRTGGDAQEDYWRIIKSLALLGIVPTLVVAVVSPWLFPALFGPEWAPAGKMAQMLVPAYLFTVIAGALNMTLTVAGWQKTQTAWEILRLVAMVGVWLFALWYDLPLLVVLGAHTAVLILSSITFVALAGYAIHHPHRQLQ